MKLKSLATIAGIMTATLLTASDAAVALKQKQLIRRDNYAVTINNLCNQTIELTAFFARPDIDNFKLNQTTRTFEVAPGSGFSTLRINSNSISFLFSAVSASEQERWTGEYRRTRTIPDAPRLAKETVFLRRINLPEWSSENRQISLNIACRSGGNTSIENPGGIPSFTHFPDAPE